MRFILTVTIYIMVALGFYTQTTGTESFRMTSAALWPGSVGIVLGRQFTRSLEAEPLSI